jgi:hypothetical protein
MPISQRDASVVSVSSRTVAASVVSGSSRTVVVGRDHNPGTMSIWMAGARIKGGQAIGSSDEFGYKAQEQPISYH